MIKVLVAIFQSFIAEKSHGLCKSYSHKKRKEKEKKKEGVEKKIDNCSRYLKQ